MQIGILSNENDFSAEEVIDWLLYYNADFCRINESDIITNNLLEIALIETDDIKILSKFNHTFDFSKIDFFWNRKWGSDIVINETDYADCEQKTITNLNNEIVSIRDFILESLNDSKKIFGYCPKNSLNKLYQLSIAKKFGLRIPQTIITNSKKSIKFKAFITKPINSCISFYRQKKVFTTYTSEIKKQVLKSSFFASLVQEKIEKEYEIRTFFIDNEFYSMAILSQLETKTSIDFRRRGKNSNLRFLPYKLPIDIEEKLIKLMNALQLKTGSIDIVKSTGNEYVFLEVNPSGQYGMTSEPCNYYLDKKIAKHLILCSNGKSKN